MRILRYTFYGKHGRPKVPHADASPDAQDGGLVIRHLSCFREFCCRQFAFVGFSCPAEKNKIHVNTSSTAQGGGGSFKNMKPIGEVGCCESGMAERSH
jgi:hypothetical protein